MKAWFSVLVGLVLMAGCGDEPASPPAAAKKSDLDNNSSGNPITAPVDYLGAVGKAKKTGIKTADLASVRQAIQMFKTEEDRFPKDLNELISGQYLPALPKPPYQTKYEYNPANGEVKIVSAQ